jgi:hypothetical protein
MKFKPIKFDALLYAKLSKDEKLKKLLQMIQKLKNGINNKEVIVGMTASYLSLKFLRT